MHPILTHAGRLGVYMVAWLPIAGMIATQLVVVSNEDWLTATVTTVPLVLFYAFVCLASWYPCRAMQPGKVSLAALVVTQSISALFSATIWFVAGVAWVGMLDRVPRFEGLADSFQAIHTFYIAAGFLLYLLAAAGHYLLVTFQASQEAESRNLELQVRTQEAELAAVKAQRDQELAAQELELARTIQQRLLPPTEMEGPGFSVAARNLPARFVAGDFYDTFELPDGSLALVVADVAGKGVGASLIMASVKAMLPLIAARNSVTGTLTMLNEKLADELAPREFVALCLARYDPVRRTAEIANAGLPDPYLLHDCRSRAVVVPGDRLPLGVRKAAAYESRTVDLAPGDQLLLLSDGLPEAPLENGDPLGYAALEALLDHQEATPSEWLDRLLERHAAAAVGGLADDVTALVLQAELSAGVA